MDIEEPRRLIFDNSKIPPHTFTQSHLATYALSYYHLISAANESLNLTKIRGFEYPETRAEGFTAWLQHFGHPHSNTAAVKKSIEFSCICPNATRTLSITVPKCGVDEFHGTHLVHPRTLELIPTAKHLAMINDIVNSSAVLEGLFDAVVSSATDGVGNVAIIHEDTVLERLAYCLKLLDPQSPFRHGLSLSNKCITAYLKLSIEFLVWMTQGNLKAIVAYGSDAASVLQVKPISNPGFNRDLLLQPQTSKFFSGVPVFHTPHAAGLFRSESVAPYIAGTKLFVEEGEDFELGEGEELSVEKAVAASVKKEIKGVINLSTVSSIVAGVSRFGVKDEAVKGRMCEDSFKLLKEDGKQLGWSCFALHDSFGTASMTHNLAPSDVIRRYVGLGENWEGNVGAKMMTSGAHTSMCHDELYVNTATVYSVSVFSVEAYH
ncbi:hypothetical protein BCR33DRAFT_387971 [Rhizoclosmatium globosum]|uniref:Uncharacterized protein n=1 Tax=Rhizoclosmatium globosum TaxID=329046 RepID=A0A1Y1ZLM8_9FUNG|nr:hypothetical protein BCR33DRAFT_387971 [Rhizoclosmatium globosum]|eukprot:ORY11171.1 hypothetical protein BCR33DRAFT_387971 [Rhizoclosmatium globosum]